MNQKTTSTYRFVGLGRFQSYLEEKLYLNLLHLFTCFITRSHLIGYRFVRAFRVGKKEMNKVKRVYFCYRLSNKRKSKFHDKRIPIKSTQ